MTSRAATRLRLNFSRGPRAPRRPNRRQGGSCRRVIKDDKSQEAWIQSFHCQLRILILLLRRYRGKQVPARFTIGQPLT